jgi:hypothetical protein
LEVVGPRYKVFRCELFPKWAYEKGVAKIDGFDNQITNEMDEKARKLWAHNQEECNGYGSSICVVTTR